MNKSDLMRLPTDELWKFYETVTETLANRILAEKQELDAKLSLLQQHGLLKPTDALRKSSAPHEKRKYPKVLQKYRNPHDPTQTWSGRGKQPLWVAKLVKSGTDLEKAMIPHYRRTAEKAA